MSLYYNEDLSLSEIAENSGNPHLQCRIVKDCGHEPSADMMDAVFHALEEQAKE